MKQHIYVRSAVSPKFRHYAKVDEALETLFGLNYETYRNKSDWLSTDYGTLRYEISTAMGDSSSYAIRIYFDPDDFDPRLFKDLLVNAKNAGINVSSQYMNGNSDFGKSEPQINLKVGKVYPYDFDTKAAIERYVENLSNDYFGIDKAHCNAIKESVDSIEFRLECYYVSSWIWGDEGRVAEEAARTWLSNTDQSDFDNFASTIPSSILSQFTSVVSAKVTYIGNDYRKGDIDFKVKF